MISLLTEKWLPILRRTGQVDWIAPHQITEPDVVAFAANRADFNGALAQMMISLLQTATPIDDEGGWEDLLDSPPDAEVLQKWFAPTADAFVLDGENARFMQDLSLTEGAGCMIDALLIDTAGSSAVDKNTDHFVKRDTIKAMCPHCVAAALFTLQTNAPAGGAGHRTSLRGGGPLTTLVVATPSRGLWQDLWLNVKPQRVFLQQGGDVRKIALHFTFPWLAEIGQIQALGGETQPLQVHPHHLFWAMPRRIRLDFSDVLAGQCDICKRQSAQLVHRYITRPLGLNYKGAWRHPFSPYYETKEGWLPVHPQPGGFTYKNWLAWAVGQTQSKRQVQAATIVNYVLSEGRQNSECRLWVFGYDMDNMKPRCWYEAIFPLYDLAGSNHAAQVNLQALVKNFIEASEQVVLYLRQGIKQAWFGDSELRGDLSFVDKAFWDGTESDFYRQLKGLVARSRSDVGIDLDDTDFIVGLGEAWLKVLRDKALRLFDVDIVGAGTIAQQDPRRVAEAYNSLKRNLSGKTIRTILRLPVLDKPARVSKTSKAITKIKSPVELQVP